MWNTVATTDRAMALEASGRRPEGGDVFMDSITDMHKKQVLVHEAGIIPHVVGDCLFDGNYTSRHPEIRERFTITSNMTLR